MFSEEPTAIGVSWFELDGEQSEEVLLLGPKTDRYWAFLKAVCDEANRWAGKESGETATLHIVGLNETACLRSYCNRQ